MNEGHDRFDLSRTLADFARLTESTKKLGLAMRETERVLRRYGIDTRHARKTARYNAKMSARAKARTKA